MTANENNFGFINTMEIIQIPFFQRAYVWEEKHWLKLWNDLIDSYEHNYSHFLGSIILKHDATSFLLIDGQQRVTTFSILLRVIGEQLNILEKSQKLRNCLFGQDNEYNNVSKIQHSRLDKEVFSAIILGKPIKEVGQKSSIYQCYEYFLKRITEYKKAHGENSLKRFLDKILTDNLFVLVDIDKDEDAQRIFDSINASGLPLASFDIVKNNIFSHFANKKTAEDIYNKYWIPVFEKDEEIKEFWDEEILTGREKKPRTDIFLHNFAIIEQIFDPYKETMGQMSEVYKKYIKNKNESILVEFIKKFTDYAKIFITLPFFHIEEEYEYDDTMKRFLQVSHTLQLSTLTPLALFLELKYTQNVITEQEYTNVLQLLEIYVIRRAILNLDTSGYNKTIFNLIDKLSKSNCIYSALKEFLETLKADIDRFPNDKELQNLSFERFDSKLAKLLLFWIELKRRKDDNKYSDSKGPLQYNFQLEHLMPRSWRAYWKIPILNSTLDQLDKVLKDKYKIQNSIYNMSDYEFIEQLNKLGYDSEQILREWNTRNEKINELGNYTILSGKLNNSLKNYEWKRKLNGAGNKKGIKYYSSLSLNRELCEYPEWTEDTITERTQKLKDYIIEIW